MPSLIIKSKKYIADTKPHTFRLPSDMIEELDRIAALTNLSRNELVYMLLEFGLKHVEIVEK